MSDTRIAIVTIQATAVKTDKYLAQTYELSLSLDRRKDFNHICGIITHNILHRQYRIPKP